MLGKFDEGLQHYEQGLEMEEQISTGMSTFSGIDKYLILAKIYRARGRYAEADNVIVRAMPLTRMVLLDGGPQLATLLEERAALYREAKMGSGWEPEAWERSAKALWEKYPQAKRKR